MSYHPRTVANWGIDHGFSAVTPEGRKELAEAYVNERQAPAGMSALTIENHLKHYVKGERVGFYNADGSTTPEPLPPTQLRAGSE
jgi:hypothetical protein